MLQQLQRLQQQFPTSRPLLDLAEIALQCVDPAQLLRRHLQLKGETLWVQGQAFLLRRYKRIIVVGAGKATYGMAQALDQLLGNRISTGLINVPAPARRHLGRIQVLAASHPYPDVATVAGAKKILQLVADATVDDLIICLMSGGGSSMLALPLPGIRLADKIRLTKQLMHASADVMQLNTIRKHLSKIKGGRLAQAAAPATMISLIISDVIGDRLDMIASGPTVPDATTTADALEILDHYRLKYPAIRQALADTETPKKLPSGIHNFLIGSSQLVLETIEKQAKKMGLHPVILTSSLRGEAKEVAQVLTAIAREVEQYSRPVRPPALLLAGGETTVKVLGQGHGGRNQELVLAAVPFLSSRMSILSLATDGVDGHTPRPVVGALADASVAQACVVRNIKYHDYLYDNNSYHCLRRLGCLLHTGPTGTNVGDIVMVFIR